MAVWGKNTRLSREVLFMRRSVMDGMRWSGTKMMCRMSWSPQEGESGKIAHCPYCWDEILKQSDNSCCPHCFGTGYANGGYSEPFVVWCSILENTSTDTKYEKAGLRVDQNMRLVLPCEPIFRDGDLFAEIRENHGVVTGIGRIYQLDAPIERQTVQGWVSNVDFDDTRRTVVEDMIIAQRGTAKPLLPSDARYKAGPEFWGISGTVDNEHIKQGDEPTIDLDGRNPGFANPYDWWN